MDIKSYIESGVIESYVLGMASSQEIAEMERLSGQYPEIRQAVASFEVALEKTSLKNASMPNAAAKEKLMFILKDEFAQPSAILAPLTQAPVRNMGWARYMAAASVILLVVSAAMNFYFYSEFKSANEKYAALINERNTLEANLNIYKTKTLDIYSNMQLMSDPVMVKVSMANTRPGEKNLATVFWDSKSKDVYLLANQLPQTPTDKQYQLWAMVDGKPVDAGMISDCDGLCKLKNITRAQAFAITLENKGGSPTPHLDQLYVMGKVTG